MEMNMKNLIKSTVVLVLGCVVLLTTMTAWAVKSEKYVEAPISFTDVLIFDCSWFDMEFEVWGEWILNEYGQAHFDNEGNMVMVNGFYYLTEKRVWNSTDPSKFLIKEDVAGKIAHRHFIVNWDENGVPTQYKESGVFGKMVVPGYGQIRLSAGHLYYVFDAGWILVNETPNVAATIEDAYALCTYLE
jgi:hypothetical protein